MDKQEILQIVYEATEDLKANNTIVLDMEGITPISDYFLICDANNERQVQAIARSIKNALDEAGIDIKRMEGFDQGKWILLDIDYVVCHIFHKEERDYYNLERLWGDAPHVTLEDKR